MTELLRLEPDLQDDPLEREISRQVVIAMKPLLGRKMNDQLIGEIEYTARAVAERFKREGIAFPTLVPVVLRSAGEIKLFRADLDEVGVENVIRALAAYLQRTRPNVPDDQIMIEIARAVMRAWPWYRGPAR